MVAIYAILSAIFVSLVAVIAAIPLLLKKKIKQSTLLLLLSVSIGALLGVVFIDFLPEAISHGYTLGLAIFLILGFLVMLVVEKLVHYNHNKDCADHSTHGHSHAYALAPVNLIGEAVHNFLDGLVIAGSYVVSIPLGITATISIILHELPQEIADMGILLYSGFSRKKALFYNFLSGVTAVVGTVVGLILAGSLAGFTSFIIPFAAGNFLYIAASNLVPQLHRECGIKDTFLHVGGICLGVGIIILIVLFGPAHGHF